MRNGYVVSRWVKRFGEKRSKYLKGWEGKSMFKAMLAMRRMQKAGEPRLKIEWRK